MILKKKEKKKKYVIFLFFHFVGNVAFFSEYSFVPLPFYLVSGTRFSMLDWVRVTGLSCTKGVWYIYDWDTRSSILP